MLKKRAQRDLNPQPSEPPLKQGYNEQSFLKAISNDEEDRPKYRSDYDLAA